MGFIPVSCSPCTESWMQSHKSALCKLFDGPPPDASSWGLGEPHALRPARREEAIVRAWHPRAPPPSHAVAAFSGLTPAYLGHTSSSASLCSICTQKKKLLRMRLVTCSGHLAARYQSVCTWIVVPVSFQAQCCFLKLQ